MSTVQPSIVPTLRDDVRVDQNHLAGFRELDSSNL